MSNKRVTVPVSSTDTCEIRKSPWGNHDYVDYGCTARLGDLDYDKLDDVIEKLQEFKKSYGDKYKDLSFRSMKNCGCYGNCICSPSLVLYGSRDENEVEKTFRLKGEEMERKRQEERDRNELERLKKKLGEK